MLSIKEKVICVWKNRALISIVQHEITQQFVTASYRSAWHGTRESKMLQLNFYSRIFLSKHLCWTIPPQNCLILFYKTFIWNFFAVLFMFYTLTYSTSCQKAQLFNMWKNPQNWNSFDHINEKLLEKLVRLESAVLSATSWCSLSEPHRHTLRSLNMETWGTAPWTSLVDCLQTLFRS